MSLTRSGVRRATQADLDALETREWTDSLREVLARRGPERVEALLAELQLQAQRRGVVLPVTSRTPYVNSIPPQAESAYPGDRDLERRIKSLVRWNAMAMVVRANRDADGIGGHISTYASAATLYEVGFHHVFRGRGHPCGGDHVYFQGHASPGVYARAYVEGRLDDHHLEGFRRELSMPDGLPSYPHPRLLPDFWEFPTVSMGLGPITALYRARFMRYLEHRGLVEPDGARVWCFVGDGECDEPETLGAISLAAREGLDNLIFVVNCNLQRLDGPVRGNGKIVQELEAAFRGAGWHVIKVLWGSEWDDLLAHDDGRLVRRMTEAVDGDYLKYRVEGGAYIRDHFWGADEALLQLVEDRSDEELWGMSLGGHDVDKVYAAYRAAESHQGAPSVILAKTIKGYGLGEAGEGRNVTHQQKKLDEEELLYFRDRFEIPIDDERVDELPFFRPDEDSPESEYLRDRRAELGGYVPERVVVGAPDVELGSDPFDELRSGTDGRPVSTTMAFVRLLSALLKEEGLGERVVPIVPDEARTFGLDALFRQCGIYSSVGQLYDPVDSGHLLRYAEARDGQILEEGITEAGSLSSFLAAGTAYATHGVHTVPIFLFYSMFGFQRVGDLVWAASDSMCRGFLVGATSGRTTLAGEGLQHQDGQSHLLALPVCGLRAYDPAYAYEIAVIVEDGLRSMLEEDEEALVYLTIGNETYAQPPMPEGAEQDILRGLHRVRLSQRAPDEPLATLFGSGAILPQVLRAAELLEDDHDVAAEVWSATSYKCLYDDARAVERWNGQHAESEPRTSHLERCIGRRERLFVAATDYVEALPGTIARWLPGRLVALGTDGFGRSDTREALRRHFGVDVRSIVLATLRALVEEGAIDDERLHSAYGDLESEEIEGTHTEDGTEESR